MKKYLYKINSLIFFNFLLSYPAYNSYLSDSANPATYQNSSYDGNMDWVIIIVGGILYYMFNSNIRDRKYD